MMKLEHLLAIVVFACTMGAYIVFLTLGRKWRKGFEAQGVKYWTAPKEERVKELVSDVWQPKLVAAFYALAYFTNGYMKMSFGLWAPLFLLNVVGISTFEAALFIGLIYVSWQWKMFLGMASDAIVIKFRGSSHRRHQWFFLAGFLGIVGSMFFLYHDPVEMPVWTFLFPVFTLIIAGGAVFDMAADAYALDVVPPEFHARILGGVQTVGMAIGGVAASLIPPLLIRIGGYRLVFLTGGLTCALAFPFLILREPKIEHERAFGKQAIAFTFTEKSVPIAALLMMSNSIGLSRLVNPTGGMFSLIMNEVVRVTSTDLAAKISLVTLLMGIPGSLIGGWAADKWGHKRTFIIGGIVVALSGFLWITLKTGVVIQFIVLAMYSNFIQRLNAGGRMGLMGDSTPLALSATVFQMYMSFSWIGNVPASIIVGALLPINLPLLIVFLSSFSFLPLVFVKFLKPYETGKAVRV